MNTRKVNIYFSLFLMGLSTIIYVTARGFPHGLRNVGYGPGFFPNLVSLIIFLLSIALLFQNIKFKTESEDTQVEEDVITFRNTKVLFPTLFALIVYVIILKHIGFIVSSFLFLTTTMMTMKISIKKSVIVSAAITMLIYYLFVGIFKVNLPTFNLL